MKCVVLDLEFTDLVPEDSADPLQCLEASPLHISCAATLLSDSSMQPMIWSPEKDVDFLTVDILTHLLAYLETMISMGQTLVTWGGMSSDFRMLRKECPHLQDTIRNMALSSIDVPFVSACHQGMLMSLSSAGESLGISDKDPGSSKGIPDLWKQGFRDMVHEHVSRDVRLTMEVFQTVCQTGILQWKTQRGFIRKWKFPKECQTVHRCLMLPKPDVPFEVKPTMDPKVQSRWL